MTERYRIVAYGLGDDHDEGDWTTDPAVLERDVKAFADAHYDWVYVERDLGIGYTVRAAFAGDAPPLPDADEFIAALSRTGAT